MEVIFVSHLNNISSSSTDCFGTSFSTFESSMKIVYPPVEICRSTEYPYNVMCNICRKVIQAYRMRFIYENITEGKPHPGRFSAGNEKNQFDIFCKNFVDDNVAFVKVELATKSITRSLKDKRMNFVSQLSSLGNYYFKCCSLII
jgi:hypothetical protein